MRFILLLALVLGASSIPVKDDCTADIVFVVDTSDSICASVHEGQDCAHWDNMVTFLANFTDSFQVSWGGTRISLVHFSGLGDTGVLFYLNRYFSDWGVKNAISSFDYWKNFGDTNTGGGLKLVNEQVLTQANGDRQDNVNIVLMFTDGNWDVGPNPTNYADALWARGDTFIYAVGIGGDVSNDKLLQLVRRQENIYEVKDYLSLNDHLKNELLNVTGCYHNVDHCAANPCKNSGTCTDIGSSFVCTCPAGFEGYNCGQVTPCYTNECQHGGTCYVNGYDFSCGCTPEWLGQYCEAMNPCFYMPCTDEPVTGTAPNIGHCVVGPVDCTTMATGNYNTIGICQQGYTECVNGITYQMKCAAELFYNCRTDQCDYKQNNPDCQ